MLFVFASWLNIPYSKWLRLSHAHHVRYEIRWTRPLCGKQSGKSWVWLEIREVGDKLCQTVMFILYPMWETVTFFWGLRIEVVVMSQSPAFISLSSQCGVLYYLHISPLIPSIWPSGYYSHLQLSTFHQAMSCYSHHDLPPFLQASSCYSHPHLSLFFQAL